VFVDNPLSPPEQSLSITKDGVTAKEQFSRRPTYEFQLEAFRDAVLKGTLVPTRGADSLATIQLLDSIRALASKG
jgi:predicted dehydrogenase